MVLRPAVAQRIGGKRVASKGQRTGSDHDSPRGRLATAPTRKCGGAGAKCRDHCVKNRVVCRAVADSMVLSPPLIADKDDIDELVKRLRLSIDDTARDLGVM